MEKSRFALCVLVMLAFSSVLVFAGGAGEPKSPAGPVSVVFYLWDDPAYPPIIDAYNQSQKEVFVDAKYIPSGEYEAKISTLLAGGAEMDGYMQKRSTDYFSHYANGYIAPLTDLCKKYNFDVNAIAGYVSGVSIGKEIVAIPFRGASYFTYYNKKIFEKAGIATPETYVKNGQWTWPKFIDVARQIKAKVPDVYGGFLYTWGSNNVMPALQNGMQFIDASGKVDINQSLINSYKYRKALEKDQLIMPLTETKITKTHYSKPFYAGQVGMLIIGEWFPGFMIKGHPIKRLPIYLF